MTRRILHLELAGPARLRALLLDGTGQVRRVAERSMKGKGALAALAALCRDLGLDPEAGGIPASAEWQRRALPRDLPLGVRLGLFWGARPKRGRLV